MRDECERVQRLEAIGNSCHLPTELNCRGAEPKRTTDSLACIARTGTAGWTAAHAGEGRFNACVIGAARLFPGVAPQFRGKRNSEQIGSMHVCVVATSCASGARGLFELSAVLTASTLLPAVPIRSWHGVESVVSHEGRC